MGKKFYFLFLLIIINTLCATNNITQDIAFITPNVENLSMTNNIRPTNNASVTRKKHITITSNFLSSYTPTIDIKIITKLLNQAPASFVNILGLLPDKITANVKKIKPTKQTFNKTHSTIPDIIKKDPGFSKLELTKEILSLDQNETPEASTSSENYWDNFDWSAYEQQYAQKKESDVKIVPYINGFGEIKMYSLKIDGSRSNALSDAIYKSLIKKSKESDFTLESRFNILLKAKINDNIEVNYNIQQEPNMPQKNRYRLTHKYN